VREGRTIEEVGLQLAHAQVVRARVAVDAARDDEVIADEDARDRVARLVEHLERRAVLRPAGGRRSSARRSRDQLSIERDALDVEQPHRRVERACERVQPAKGQLCSLRLGTRRGDGPLASTLASRFQATALTLPT